MRNIQFHAARAPAHAQAAWQRVALPASRGLLSYARGDYARAVDELGRALPRLAEIGGSHAQRDLFSQIHLDALIRSGQLARAQHLLGQQLRSQPESARLTRQAAKVYAALGLGSVATSFF